MKHWQSIPAEIENAILKSKRLGLITDMDGTISEIVLKPDDAEIVPSINDLLKELQPHLTLLAVVSGRSINDLRNRINFPGLVYVGNHGFEWQWNGVVEIAPEAQSYRPALEDALGALYRHKTEGMTIEDKGATISVHYRQTPNPDYTEKALAPIVKQIANQHQLNVFQGRMVFELRPPVAINKGTALARLVERYNLDAAIYMGDDTTDADALQMAQQLRHTGRCEAFGIAVVSDDTPSVVLESADFSSIGINDVERFLFWLLNARTASSS